MNVIEAKNVSFSYNGGVMLKQVHFAIKPGDFVGVVGANGAGKSTLLKLMVGLLSPDEGEIRLFGEKADRFKDFKRLAYVPQKSWSYFTGFPVNVNEFVLTGLCGKAGLFRPYNKRDKERANECLDEVGMLPMQSLKLTELSAGQMQRVLMAKALTTKPVLLILDEPTAGIDVDSTSHISAMLADLNQKNGVTVIIVTHDLPSLQNYPDYLMEVSDDGTIKLTQR
jgi:zinc transport system ATP-binding protein